MSARKSTKTPAAMKQAVLSFAMKRTGSATIGVEKPSQSATHKRPVRTTTSVDAIIPTSDSDDHSPDEAAIPAPKKRRLERPTRKTADIGEAQGQDSPVGPEPEKERLDLSDPRWLKVYGEAREQMGNIDPVHAKGQSMVHHILRVFDLSYQYGPCVGVSRLDRWERAQALGLNPPSEIKEILLTKEGGTDEQLSQSVFLGEI